MSYSHNDVYRIFCITERLSGVLETGTGDDLDDAYELKEKLEIALHRCDPVRGVMALVGVCESRFPSSWAVATSPESGVQRKPDTVLYTKTFIEGPDGTWVESSE